MEKQEESRLPVVEDCQGCGVCCLHMGYPAFMLPRGKATDEQIESTAELQSLLQQGWTRQELREGHAGGKYWHSLPESLKVEWIQHVADYQRPGELDGPCFWLDKETRLCKHHEFRPAVCRDFEIGSKPCVQWRNHYCSLIELKGARRQ